MKESKMERKGRRHSGEGKRYPAEYKRETEIEGARARKRGSERERRRLFAG